MAEFLGMFPLLLLELSLICKSRRSKECLACRVQYSDAGWVPMKGMVQFIRNICMGPKGFWFCFLAGGLVGCQTGGKQIAEAPGEASRVCVINYGCLRPDSGVYGNINIFSDGSYFWEDFTKTNRDSLGALHAGRLSSELLLSLQQSVQTNHLWTPAEGVPICDFMFDDSNTSYPPCVGELVEFVLSNVPLQPLTAKKIREKILGTWFLLENGDGRPPATKSFTFDADGTFTSSNSITRHVDEATWQAHDRYFTITISHSLPQNSFVIFTVFHLDDHIMISGQASMAGRYVFIR